METLVAPEPVKDLSIPAILQQVTLTIFGRQVTDYYFQKVQHSEDYLLQDLEEYFAIVFQEKPIFHKIETFKRVEKSNNSNSCIKQVYFEAEVIQSTKNNTFERKLVNLILHFANISKQQAISQVTKQYPISTINNISTFELSDTQIINDPNSFTFNYFKPEFLKQNK